MRRAGRDSQNKNLVRRSLDRFDKTAGSRDSVASILTRTPFYCAVNFLSVKNNAAPWLHIDDDTACCMVAFGHIIYVLDPDHADSDKSVEGRQGRGYYKNLIFQCLNPH